MVKHTHDAMAHAKQNGYTQKMKISRSAGPNLDQRAGEQQSGEGGGVAATTNALEGVNTTIRHQALRVGCQELGRPPPLKT